MGSRRFSWYRDEKKQVRGVGSSAEKEVDMKTLIDETMRMKL